MTALGSVILEPGDLAATGDAWAVILNLPGRSARRLTFTDQAAAVLSAAQQAALNGLPLLDLRGQIDDQAGDQPGGRR